MIKMGPRKKAKEGDDKNGGDGLWIVYFNEKVFHQELLTVVCENNNEFMHLSFILFLHKN